jgi:hypothetical protein
MFNQKNAITTLLWVAHEGIIFGKRRIIKKILQAGNFVKRKFPEEKFREIGTVPKFFIRITSSSIVIFVIVLSHVQECTYFSPNKF